MCEAGGREKVEKTVLGSALFVRQSGRHLAELRNMVTSPGGTSADAIYQLEKGGPRTVLSKAVWTAYQKSVQLGTAAQVDRSSGLRYNTHASSPVEGVSKEVPRCNRTKAG